LISAADIDIRGLSKVGSPEEDLLSIYFKSRDRSDLEAVRSRLRIMNKALPDGLAPAFEKSLSLSEAALASDPVKGEKGRMIFASGSVGLLKVFRLGVELEAVVVLDRSPFLLPLARLRNDYEDYGLIMVDSREARLYLIRSDILEEKSRSSIDLMNKHKKGGMSQMRFNRLRTGAIKSFLSTVAYDLSSSPDLESIGGLIVAGPGQAKSMLVEEMTESLRRRVMDLVDMPMDIDRRELVKIGDGISMEEERTAAFAALEDLKSAVLKGRPSACGPKEAHLALDEGRVSLLVLKNDFAMPGMVCKSCQIIPEISQQSCPSCGGHLSQENMAEELLRLAQRTGAEVVLADGDPFLESIGGVGAILRY